MPESKQQWVALEGRSLSSLFPYVYIQMESHELNQSAAIQLQADLVLILRISQRQAVYTPC
ncbi:hypothetical protein BCY86_07145 [Pajaroellobacter abortibovis]|uniref:Uncharacterized protein n=1 Tax=Pajaroellobacter abortibovis TaxID=1882918 RepID=A0A1L6MYI9_9BACT|nr:hypothetical protein BCY86_07145 [Pajaroellobacter abortibovis]